MTTVSNSVTTISNAAAVSTCATSANLNHPQHAYMFAFKPYSAWSQNWRVYDDETSTGNPQFPLAAQNVTATVKPNNTVRLRVAYAELGGNAQADTRKKLQYSSGAGCPDSNSCVWTDVGAQGSAAIWRYGNGGATDNAAVASPTLDGATASGYVIEDGTATATGTLHSAGTVAEYDFTLQNNNATIGTTYYFRAYDFGASISAGTYTNLNPILRQQQLTVSGTETTPCTTSLVASVCSYPSLLAYTSAPHPPTFYRPTNANTNVSTAPVIQLKASDDENDNIQYVIEWCSVNTWPCSIGGGVTGGSFDQTLSQTNWNGQDADSFTTYMGNASEVISSMAAYSVQPGTLRPSTTYYLRAKATDPNGSGLYGLYSSVVQFTTASLEIRIIGGTSVSGGTRFGN
jgi:hypothetical protein